MKYRPEIDGLRTIAVMSVLIYHLKIEIGAPVGDHAAYLMSGGFLGVDVFFVISGYLITTILMQDLAANGRISYGRFYWRRARRILPPLLLVALVSLPFAWRLLTPGQMEEFGRSLIAALAFVANGFWFKAQNVYGAEASTLKPFLHTWSLAVEEQFYIVFPLILALLRRVGGLRWGLIAFVGLGLVAAEITTDLRPNFSFYSPVSRAWELGAGALLAWSALSSPARAAPAGLLARAAPGLGLVLILGSIAVFSIDTMRHPGLQTVPVVLGTCLIVRFAARGEPVTRLLSTKLFTGIGKISYSLYLWHFPIYAFGRLALWDIGPAEWIAALALSFALSIVSYVLVERPFRSAVSPRLFLGASGLAAAAITAFGVVMIATGGLDSRLDRLRAQYQGMNYDNMELRAASWAPLGRVIHGDALAMGNQNTPSAVETRSDMFPEDGRRKVLIVGNSHSKDVYNALTLNQALFPDMAFARYAISMFFEPQDIDTLVASPSFRAADVIFVVQLYREGTLGNLPHFVARMTGEGKRIVLSDQSAIFADWRGMPVVDGFVRRGDAPYSEDAVERLAYAQEEGGWWLSSNAEIAAMAAMAGAGLVSRRNLICDDAAKRCDVITPDRRKALYDYSHWSLAGAQHFGRKAAADGWGDVLRAAPPR
jgi:peptidoglycan/LPS O-acetylase OafA/YrhL